MHRVYPQAQTKDQSLLKLKTMGNKYYYLNIFVACVIKREQKQRPQIVHATKTYHVSACLIWLHVHLFAEKKLLRKSVA